MTTSESSQKRKEFIAQASVSGYQVFLSFRGPDSRQDLADVLYNDMIIAGIRTFRDNNELEVGDKISDLLPAIGNSRICVPIFSTTFAESAWCLSELEEMVKLEKYIMPIFYKVTPDDVKLKTELFKTGLEKHTKFGERVKKWEDALRAVPETIGREVKTTGIGEFSADFVRILSTKLGVKMKYVTPSLVRRHHQTEALIELLNVGRADDEPRVVGVHGVSVIGKTTLAAVVFNQLFANFNCHSFLENIPVTPGVMEKQLLEDLDPKLKGSQGYNPQMKLTEIFQQVKVLIVLDNVIDPKQVQKILEMRKYFRSESRIIITTKNTEVLTKEVYRFEAIDMKKNEALQLFSRHAFNGADSPPPDMKMLSEEVVGLTGHLPLALEVLGSLFQRCDKNDWVAQIKMLKEIPNPDIMEWLKVSVDSLKYEEKHIFLDIACFFIHKEKSGSMYMWDACGFHPDVCVKALNSKSLVTITSEDKFRMHDMIRDLGRELVRRECIGNAANRSRIWTKTKALEALRSKKKDTKVQGLFLEEPYPGGLTGKELSKFGELRLLKLVGTKLEGDLAPIFPELKWFTWYECPVDPPPSNLSLEELVVLDLSRSGIEENWAGWSLIQTAKKLKVLDLTNCWNLKSTPDLSSNEALERLILTGCRHLAEIHVSITKLKTLMHLSFDGCDGLKGLPEGFDLLTVRSFSWHRCPSNFDTTDLCWRELVVLDLSHSFISETWAGWRFIKDAKKLKVLDLTECLNLKSIPDLSNSKALERLILRGCQNLAQIHGSTRKMMKHLDTDGCSSLRESPEEFGSLGKSEEPTLRKDDLEAYQLEYDVFLSFTGPDSRQGLADVLYSDMTAAGIRVFRDDDELEIGDKISQILRALENSKICVPIFSKNFAASPWCLREVEAMVEHGKAVVPVFYTASPDDVQLRTDSFKKDLRKHEKKHGSEQVRKWEDALRTVTSMTGQEVRNTGFAEFSKSLTRNLMIKLAQRQIVPHYFVNIDYGVKALLELLDIDADDVRLVGIHGMGGVGKTTLAKVVFNKLLTRFDCSIFLENIREYSRIEDLQRQLLVDLEPKMEHYFQATGTVELLSQNFRHRKVLVILDDVNKREQVDMIDGMLGWFGIGSRIIITTRDKRIFSTETRAFEVKVVNQDQALQTFSGHAFGADSPPSDYQILSGEGIGLTGRNKRGWESITEKLEKSTDRDVHEIRPEKQEKGVRGELETSFGALEHEERQIFLDIACFFVGRETSSAICMWEACGFIPDDGIEALVSVSLLKIEGNVFLMNDSVRDFGRELVREECADDPAERSRIWSQTEASEVLMMKNKEKPNVGSLFLEEPFGDILTNEEFAGFRRLRLLKLVGTKLEGDFTNLLRKLRWFSWHQCPLDFVATNLSLRNLVVLDLSRSLITESWGGWSSIQMAKSLKVLDLSDCCDLKSTPDLSNNKALERLILNGCHKLFKLHVSIGKLKTLKHLDLRGCSSLEGFKEDAGWLKDVEEVLVDERRREGGPQT